MRETDIFQRNRPAWVWAISIYLGAGSIFGLAIKILILLGRLPLPSSRQIYFSHPSILEFCLDFALSLASLVAAISLFSLRKFCVYPLAVAFLISIGLCISFSQRVGWLPLILGPGTVSLLVNWGIMAAVLKYVLKLTRKGILR